MFLKPLLSIYSLGSEATEPKIATHKRRTRHRDIISVGALRFNQARPDQIRQELDVARVTTRNSSSRNGTAANMLAPPGTQIAASIGAFLASVAAGVLLIGAPAMVVMSDMPCAQPKTTA